MLRSLHFIMLGLCLTALPNISRAAVVVQSGSGELYASGYAVTVLSEFPGPYSLTKNDQFSLPTNTSRSVTVTPNDYLPPGYPDMLTLGGYGSAQVTTNSLGGGLTLNGSFQASTYVISGVGGGYGTAGIGADLYLAVTNVPATFSLKTPSLSPDANFILNVWKDGLEGGGNQYLQFYGNFLLPYTAPLPVGTYHISIVSGASTYQAEGRDPGAGGSFNLTVVPEVPSVAMMGGLFAIGLIAVVLRRRNSLQAPR